MLPLSLLLYTTTLLRRQNRVYRFLDGSFTDDGQCLLNIDDSEVKLVLGSVQYVKIPLL